MGARIVCGAGPRGLEQAWLAELLADQQSVRLDPARLRLPGVVLVPSRSLRQHCMASAVAELADLGGVLLGVRIVALPAFVHSLLEPGQHSGSLAFGALVQRAAAVEFGPTQTAAELSLVEAAVRDLLHAHYQPELEPVCREALRAAGLPRSIVGRAEALLAIAAQVCVESERQGVCAPGAEFARAIQVLRDRHEAGWRWLHIVGFADATGSALEFLEQLIQQPEVTLYQDGLASQLEERGFGLRLRERLLAASGASRSQLDADAEGRIELVRGRVEAAELREVARSIEACIEQGLKPERIGIVARGMEQSAARLRLTLQDLGVPCSAIEVRGTIGADERAARALQELVRSGEEWRLARWALARGRAWAQDGWQLLAACHLLGATTLAQLAELDLAVRMGGLERLALPSPDLADPELAAPQTVARESIAGLVSAARALREDWLALLGRRGHTSQLLPACGEFLHQHFALDPQHWEQLERSLLEDAAPGFEWRAQEFLQCLLREYATRCRAPLAGSGGGVAILDVMEARARTFDALFVIGLQAGRFPQRSAEDPLLPESVRRALQPVLETLPLKSGIRAEDQYYFESLLRSASRVTLSWSIGDELGVELAVSPLVEALVRERGLQLPDPCDLPQSWRGREDSTPAERSLARAVQAPELEHARVLEELWAPERALAHQTVLLELEPGWSGRARPGLYLGRVGRALPPDRPVSVSAFESTARCPWQAFLRRVLRLRTVQDPLASVPDLPANVVGLVVHKVLEQLATPQGDFRWPDEARLLACTEQAAEAIVRREQLAPLGLRHWLVQLALPYLRVAGELQGQASIRVLGVEQRGEMALSGTGRKLRFIADRVEQSESGALWTDFKTGKPLTSNSKQREGPLLQAIESGEHLQVAVYAVANAAHGRYLYLGAHTPDHARVIGSAAVADPVELVKALEGALQRLDQVWIHGGFVPRLAQRGKDEEPSTCEHCEVRLACQRGDSGAKLRLQRWLQAPPDPTAAQYERAAHALLTHETAAEAEGEE
jgi:RecB family exonuclease